MPLKGRRSLRHWRCLWQWLPAEENAIIIITTLPFLLLRRGKIRGIILISDAILFKDSKQKRFLAPPRAAKYA